MGLFARVPFAIGFVVTLAAVVALVLTPRTAVAQDKPWPKMHKPKRLRKPAPPPSEPPATEETKPSTTKQVVQPSPAAVAAKPPAALEAEAQRRVRANPFPGSAPAVAPPAVGTTQVAKAAAPTMVTPEVGAPGARPGRNILERHRAALATHGTWVNEEGLGDVWLPEPAEVGADFAPYRTGGHWALTDQDQWAWVSDFDWGKAPFHYGRWDWNAARGWGWVPGTDWAPAWVLWRLGEPGFDYVGWAPVPPTKPGASGTARKISTTPVLPFWYVPSDKLFHPKLNDHVITDRKLGRTVHDHSTIFAKQLVEAAPVPQLTTAGLATLRPVSPSPKAARIPKAAIPKTRLTLTDPDQGRQGEGAQARRLQSRKRIERRHSFSSRRLRPIQRGGSKRHPKLRHRVIQKKQIRPRPRQRCRRWVRTWSGALRCTHR